MRSESACRLLRFFVAVALALSPVAWGGGFQLAGLQVTGSQIGAAQNGSGCQIRYCLAAQQFQEIPSASGKFTLHLGPFDETRVQHSTARLWALYE